MMFGDFMTSQCHKKKFRVKWEQLPAITAESELVGAAVVTTKGEKIRGFLHHWYQVTDNVKRS